MQPLLESPMAIGESKLLPERSRAEERLPVRALATLALREGNKKRPIYEIHKWWARRLASNFRMIILALMSPATVSDKELWDSFYTRHSPSHHIVLDPFSGGGTTLVEAIKLGLKPIGYDIDPVASVVTKSEISPFDPAELERAFQRIKEAVAPGLVDLYRTKDSRGKTADTISAFWVALVKCPGCKRRVELNPHFRLLDRASTKEAIVFCKQCHTVDVIPEGRTYLHCKNCSAVTTVNRGTIKGGRVTCPACTVKFRALECWKVGKPPVYEMFAVETVAADDFREFRRASKFDHSLVEKSASLLSRERAELPIPSDSIPTTPRSDPRPVSFGLATYASMFNARQLLSLGRICGEITKLPESPSKALLGLALSDSLASNNMLCSYAFGYRKLTPLFGLHAYRFVQRPVEGNVWGATFGRGSFEKCYHKVLRGKLFAKHPSELTSGAGDGNATVALGETAEAPLFESFGDLRAAATGAMVVNQSAVAMTGLPDASVDLVVTDPPYFNNLAYTELSDFYAVWHSKLFDESARVRSLRALDETLWSPGGSREEAAQAFGRRLSLVMKEVGRVSKSNAPIALTYHHSRPEAWVALMQALREGGFGVSNVHALRSEGRSGFHSHRLSIKWDAVIIGRKKGPNAANLGSRSFAPIKRFNRLKREVSESGAPFGAIDLRSLAMAVKAVDVCQRSHIDAGGAADSASAIEEFALTNAPLDDLAPTI